MNRRLFLTGLGGATALAAINPTAMFAPAAPPPVLTVPLRVLFVSASGDDITGDGTSLRPYRTISKAMEHGHWIFVSDGVYGENPFYEGGENHLSS